MPGLNSVDGLNSGLKTTDIVNTMITFERRNAVLFERDQAIKINIITSLKALQAKVLALQSTLVELTRPGTFETGSVTSSDADYLGVSSTGRVAAGSYDIQVLSLARNHQIASQGFTSEAFAEFGTGTIDIAVGDGSTKTITIDSTNNTLMGIKDAINEANAGVTASLVNDGSSSKSHRLIISSDKTGLVGSMSITSSLTGGSNLDFTNSTFDNPEALLTNSGTTSNFSLGTTAAFTGAENKIYTFTVKGTGTQTIGTDVITIDWTDGTNSGSIVVNQADTDYDLVGTGADGLQMSFTAGDLTAGDIFQVSSFSPLLQGAADAKIAFGATSGAGSPIIATSDNNVFDEVVAGVSLTVKKETAPGDSINITTDLNVDGIKTKIKAFIDAFNNVTEFIDKQNTYDQETKESGALFADTTVQLMQNSLRSALGETVKGLDSKYNQLYSVGIRTLGAGKLALIEPSRLEEALRENVDDVIKLFTSTGTATDSHIEFVSSNEKTKIGEGIEVDITQAATHASYQAENISNPGTTPITLNATNNRIKFNIDGLLSDEIVLTQKTYTSTSALVAEIQSKIDNDDKIGGRGLTVEWIATDASNGYLNFTTGSYGSSSKVEVVTSISDTSYALLGMLNGTRTAGLDVEGTINGEEAKGTGQYLAGLEDNDTSEGLRLKITFDEAGLNPNGSEGTVSVIKGVASRMTDMTRSLTLAGDGTFDRRIRSYENQIKNLQEQVEDIDDRLRLRRESLFKKFYAMEVALGKLNTTGQFLTQQLAGINMNWRGAGYSRR